MPGATNLSQAGVGVLAVIGREFVIGPCGILMRYIQDREFALWYNQRLNAHGR